MIIGVQGTMAGWRRNDSRNAARRPSGNGQALLQIGDD